MKNLRRILILAILPISGCGLFKLDPMLKASLRESETKLITPAIECYRLHGTMPDPANPSAQIPFDDDRLAAIDFEHKSLRKAIDAEVAQ
jgi:hypothetical protein